MKKENDKVVTFVGNAISLMNMPVTANQKEFQNSKFYPNADIFYISFYKKVARVETNRMSFEFSKSDRYILRSQGRGIRPLPLIGVASSLPLLGLREHCYSFFLTLPVKSFRSSIVPGLAEWTQSAPCEEVSTSRL